MAKKTEFQRRALIAGVVNTPFMFIVAIWLANRFGDNAMSDLHPLLGSSSTLDQLFYLSLTIVVATYLWMLSSLRHGSASAPKDVGF